jgi:hypothetical protein
MKATAHKGSKGRLTASRGHGKAAPVASSDPVRRLKRLPARPGFIRGDPEDLVHVDWSRERRP